MKIDNLEVSTNAATHINKPEFKSVNGFHLLINDLAISITFTVPITVPSNWGYTCTIVESVKSK